MVVGRATRTVGLCVALAVAGWLGFDALGGMFFYSVQGDLCRKVRGQIETSPSSRWSRAFEICEKRESPVYRAFLVELLVATDLVGFTARGVGDDCVRSASRRTIAEV